METMKRVLLLFIVLASLTASIVVRAQWTGPAFNPHCFYPVVGDSMEIDTIFGMIENHVTGADAGEHLGAGLRNLGPRPSEDFGTMQVVLTQDPPFDLSSYLRSFDAGPDFNLHHLKMNHRLPFATKEDFIQIGHFRDTYHNDILVGGMDQSPIIYWADDSGDFDSSRYSLFFPPKIGIYSSFSLGSAPLGAYLSTDSVLDLVYFFDVVSDTSGGRPYHDTIYIGIVKGGPAMLQLSESRAPDTSWGTTDFQQFHSYVSIADGPQIFWEADISHKTRGILAEDTGGNLLYYQRREPFRIGDLAHSLLYDTLFAPRTIPNFFGNDQWALPLPFLMRALPKLRSDSSRDLLYPILTTKTASLLIFRGVTISGRILSRMTAWPISCTIRATINQAISTGSYR